MSTLANLTEVLFRLDFDPDTAVYHYRGQTLSRLQCRTYILSQASQLARLLKPGDRVVLALNDSPSLACLFLACIAVGAIPAVINPKSREQALADIAADCQASLVVREADAPSLSGPLAPLTLRAAAGRPLLDDFSLDALVGPADLDWSAFHRQDPAAACFLQYTSGSTWAPKGVMHSLRNTLGFYRAFARELRA
ncbi:anthranilate--CoA ligase, partial [Pseudomonas aeruginosa]